MNKNRKYWRICSAIVIFLTVLVFTPFVIPEGVYTPKLLGVPFSLWTSFIITVVLVLITLIGTRVHPGLNEEEDKS